ncbi:hypothetical protein [Archangium minus]|uniref:hypothetical protein n=1 Tax=Archangium minus TaxID=83450 RepID=UPI0037BE7F74
MTVSSNTRLIASALSVLLISCGTTRATTSPDAEELTRYVLVIQESPDGQVTHDWRRAEDFDLSGYRLPSNASGSYGRIVRVASHPRDCHEEFNECVDKCVDRPLPRGHGHIRAGQKGMGRKKTWCREQCWQPYRDCEELQGRRPQEFSATEEAVEWLKRNHQSLLVGSIVVIAGVAFVTASAGAGFFVLAPAAFLAS